MQNLFHHRNCNELTKLLTSTQTFAADPVMVLKYFINKITIKLTLLNKNLIQSAHLPAHLIIIFILVKAFQLYLLSLAKRRTAVHFIQPP